MIGGDSAGTSGWTLCIQTNPKVFTLQAGRFVIGFTTSFRMGQLLQFCFEPPAHPEGMDALEYMVRDFTSAVRQCLKDGGFATKDKEQESGGIFLVGYMGRLFRIESSYQVIEPLCGWIATGCGEDIAMGAIEGQLIASRERDYEWILRQAMQVTERNNAGVRGPFHVVTGGAKA